MQREKFPDARLVLDLHQVGSASVMRGRGNQSRLPVRARLHRGQNRSIFMTDPRNVNLAGAYYLLPGDLIKGIIQYTEDGWILESFQRVATLSPPKVAALNVELSTDPNVTRPGEDVRMTLTVTNTGTAPAQFRFPSGQRSEFVVREGGREVWRWSRGRAFTQALSTLTLVPEEELRFQETWPGVDNTGQVVDPGSYTIVGWVTAEDKAELTESSAEVIVQEVRRAGPSVGDLLKNPRAYLNREITLTGVFRAHLAERGERLVEDGPPTSRSDWILKDDTGSIYVAGNGGILFDRRSDLNKRFRVHGLVRMNPEGRLYLRAWEVERLNPSRPR